MHDVHIECAFKMILDSFNIMLGFVDRGQPGGCSIPAIVPQDNLIAQLDVALEILVANSQNLDVGAIGVRKKNCFVGVGLLIGFGMQDCALYQLVGRCPDHQPLNEQPKFGKRFGMNLNDRNQESFS